MAEDYYSVWLDLLGRTSRPSFVELILDRAGVTLDQQLCRYLVFLDLKGPIGVLELGELVEHNHPKVSRCLARLAQLGYVTRGEAEHDRRIKTAELTDAGRAVVAAINAGRRRILDEAFADWTEADRLALARLTGRFSDRIGEMIDRLPAAPNPSPGD